MQPLHKFKNDCAATACLHCGSLIGLGMTPAIFCKKCVYTSYKEIEGDLALAALSGHFDVVVQDCNCFCTPRTSESKEMIRLFKTNEMNLEQDAYRGSREKLGEIEYKDVVIPVLECHTTSLTVVNAYTQFGFIVSLQNNAKPPLSYEALNKCLTRINEDFAGNLVVMPQIGCGLSGGKWVVIRNLIKKNLKDCKVTIIKNRVLVEDKLTFEKELTY